MKGPLTRSFDELVQRHVAKRPAFREALLREAIEIMLAGDVDTGKAVLRDSGLRETGQGDWHSTQKPDPDVRPSRQPTGKKLALRRFKWN